MDIIPKHLYARIAAGICDGSLQLLVCRICRTMFSHRSWRVFQGPKSLALVNSAAVKMDTVCVPLWRQRKAHCIPWKRASSSYPNHQHSFFMMRYMLTCPERFKVFSIEARAECQGCVVHFSTKQESSKTALLTSFGYCGYCGADWVFGVWETWCSGHEQHIFSLLWSSYTSQERTGAPIP